MKFLNKLFYKYIKRKKLKEEPWLSYYSADTHSIKFTTKTIYNYMKDQVGNAYEYYALNYFGTRITYGEMFRHIDNISRSLKYLGVKKGDIVTICMPNTPEAVETFYAINKIGAIADMVHPLSAPNEIKHYLNESGSRILILYDVNYEKYKNVIEETDVYKTVLVSVSESMPVSTSVGYKLMNLFKVKKAPKLNRDYISWKEFYSLHLLYHKKIGNDGMRFKDAAIILHSGGTTGKPKGILISNYSFNALAQQGHINVINVQPKDKIMTILPIFHGFGLGVCVHCPLCLKVEVILIPEFDAKRFPRTMEKYKPNVLAGVPTLWEAMMSNPNFNGIDLSRLKYVISGGDHLTTTMEERFNEFLHNHSAKISVSKGYGMTESVAATCYTFEGTNKPGSIGIPMYGNSLAICKPDTMDELPYGEEGEICVSGPTIMIGYLNNKEETDKVLKRHSDGRIWLHTGDAGYIAPDGIVYFTQRLKRVIVSSGFNVYPSQIEEIVETHPLVDRCSVISVPHPYKVNVAKAFVVLNKGVSPSLKIEAEIRLLCKKNLAKYSLPKYIEFVSELPKTLYNKVDYKKLEEEELKKYNEKSAS